MEPPSSIKRLRDFFRKLDESQDIALYGLIFENEKSRFTEFNESGECPLL